MNFELYNGDCFEELRKLPDNSVDSCVTDPPYGLSFMGKSWDYDVPSSHVWKEILRVLKPGGHLLAFFGSRTYHRGAVQIEDAGFEIRDQIMWLYGSGFPKSHDIGDGWGTALKPAHEPIVVARKPIEEKTIAANVLKHGTGAINIDESKVGSVDGRWPANVIHDGSDEVVNSFPEAKSGTSNGNAATGVSGDITPMRRDTLIPRNDSGYASRFFYCAKASKSDREEGLGNVLAKLPAAAEFRPNHMEKALQGEDGNPYGRWSERKNTHPTVKPTELMKYLVKLVTQKGGVVLDPFMGSGTTGKACGFEGFKFIGIERDKDYFEIAKLRIEHAYQNKTTNLESFFV